MIGLGREHDDLYYLELQPIPLTSIIVPQHQIDL